MSLIKSWNALPHAKQMQLAKQHGIKWYGTTEAQLEWDLENKLPKGLLVEEVEEIALPPEGTGSEPAVEVEEEVANEPEVVDEVLVEEKEPEVVEVEEVKSKKKKAKK